MGVRAGFGASSPAAVSRHLTPSPARLNPSLAAKAAGREQAQCGNPPRDMGIEQLTSNATIRGAEDSMDDHRFDQLTQLFANLISRRAVFGPGVWDLASDARRVRGRKPDAAAAPAAKDGGADVLTGRRPAASDVALRGRRAPAAGA
jgi:hypothetical protein